MHPGRLMEAADSIAVQAGKVRGAQNQSAGRFDACCGSPHCLMALSEVDTYMLSPWYHFCGICEKRLNFIYFFFKYAIKQALFL